MSWVGWTIAIVGLLLTIFGHIATSFWLLGKWKASQEANTKALQELGCNLADVAKEMRQLREQVSLLRTDTAVNETVSTELGRRVARLEESSG